MFPQTIKFSVLKAFLDSSRSKNLTVLRKCPTLSFPCLLKVPRLGNTPETLSEQFYDGQRTIIMVSKPSSSDPRKTCRAVYTLVFHGLGNLCSEILSKHS